MCSQKAQMQLPPDQHGEMENQRSALGFMSAALTFTNHLPRLSINGVARSLFSTADWQFLLHSNIKHWFPSSLNDILLVDQTRHCHCQSPRCALEFRTLASS